MHTLRPPTEKEPQRFCPLCGEEYMIRRNVQVTMNNELITKTIYECSGKHSWEKYPFSTPIDPILVMKEMSPVSMMSHDHYRPLTDTQELYKRK